MFSMDQGTHVANADGTSVAATRTGQTDFRSLIVAVASSLPGVEQITMLIFLFG